jgi:hypothetical protein
MLRFFLLADALPSTEGTLISAVATGVAILIVELVRRFAKEKAADRLTTISNLAHAAYIITAEVARKTPNTIDDKAAFALDVLRTAVAERGLAPLTPEETRRAEFAWRAEHSAENLRKLDPGESASALVPR